MILAPVAAPAGGRRVNRAVAVGAEREFEDVVTCSVEQHAEFLGWAGHFSTVQL